MANSINPRQFFTKDILILLTQDGLLQGFDLRDGRFLWRVQYSLTEYPSLIDVVQVAGCLYVVTFEKDYVVNALDEYKGAITWKISVNGRLHPDSLTGTKNILIVTDRKNFRSHTKAVDIHTGNTIWEWGMGGHGEGFDPLIADTRVYVGGSPHSDAEAFEQDGNKIWPIRICCLDLLTGTPLWETNHIYPYSAEHHRAIPAISDNHYPSRGRVLCVEAGEENVHMLNSLTGELLWTFDRNTGTTVRY